MGGKLCGPSIVTAAPWGFTQRTWDRFPTEGTLVSAPARPHRELRLNKAKNGITAVASEQSKEQRHCSCMQHSNQTPGTSYSIIAPSTVSVAVVHVDDVSSTSGLYSKSKRSCTSSEKRTSAFVSLFFLIPPPPLQDRIWMRVWGGVQWHLQWYVLHPGKKMDMLPPSRCTSWENRWRRFRTVWEINVALRATIFFPRRLHPYFRFQSARDIGSFLFKWSFAKTLFAFYFLHLPLFDFV